MAQRDPDFRSPGVRFDKTVTLGNILTMVGGVLALCGAYVDYKLTLDRHDIRISGNEAHIHVIEQQLSEAVKSQIEMTRALDRLTFQLQNNSKP